MSETPRTDEVRMIERLGELADADETDRKAEKTVSGQAKTLGEIVRGARGEAELTDVSLLRGNFKDGFIAALDEVDERFGHYHLIPGADAVVPEEGLEAAAASAWGAQELLTQGNDTGWRELDPTTRAVWRNSTRVALKAAGIAVCNEVVALNGPLLWVKQNGEVVEMGDGDTLYIKRRED